MGLLYLSFIQKHYGTSVYQFYTDELWDFCISFIQMKYGTSVSQFYTDALWGFCISVLYRCIMGLLDLSLIKMIYGTSVSQFYTRQIHYRTSVSQFYTDALWGFWITVLHRCTFFSLLLNCRCVKSLFTTGSLSLHSLWITKVCCIVTIQ